MALLRPSCADAIGANLRNRETGTQVAIYNNSKSGTAFSSRTVNTGNKQGWGGARNRADRVSESLSLRQAETIMKAAHNACIIGLPFNRHVTIHWERAGVPDDNAGQATSAYLTLMRDWLRKRGWPFAWAYVRENGHDKGSHVHILMHVDPNIAQPFTAMQCRWLRRITDRPYRKKVIKTSRVGGVLRASKTVPEVYQVNLAEVVGYMLKGASQETAMAFNLERLEPGGRVIGKRAGCSQNVG